MEFKTNGAKINSVESYNGTSVGINKNLYNTENINKQNDYEEIDYGQVDYDSTNETNSWYINLLEGVETYYATNFVTATSVLSGVLDLGETILDGGAWLVSTIGSWFGADTTDIKEFIARDLVTEANDAFYQNTEIGKFINDKSNLKYDSELAQGIRSVTKTVAATIAATAISFLPGGVFLVAGVGFLSGAGEAAESTYQRNGTETTVLQEVMIAGSGALTALSWSANAKLGSELLNVGKSMSELGIKTVLTEMAKNTFSKEYMLDFLKKSFLSKQSIGNYVGAGMMTASEISPFLTGEKEITVEEFLKIVGKYGLNLALNVGEDFLRDGVSDYSNKINASRIDYTLELTQTFKQKIMSEIPKNLNETEKAKFIYDKLNRQISYNVDYFFSKDPNFLNRINNINDSNMNTDLVCTEWASVYKQLLDEAGIDSNIMGKANGHQWVSMKIGKNYYVADATQPYNGMTDLTNAKIGSSSGGFIKVSEEIANNHEIAYRSNKYILEDLSSKCKNEISKIDKKIGNNCIEVTELFSDTTSTLSNKLVGITGNTVGEITSQKFELLLDETKDLKLMEKASYLGFSQGKVLSPYENSLIKRIIPKTTERGYIEYSIDLQNGNVLEYIINPDGSWTKDIVEVLNE